MYRYTNISFPAFGIDINPAREFSIGPLSIHMYGCISWVLYFSYLCPS